MDYSQFDHLDPALAEAARYELELLLEAAAPRAAPSAIDPFPPPADLPALPTPRGGAASPSVSPLLLLVICAVAILLLGLGMASMFVPQHAAGFSPVSSLPPDTTHEVPGTWNVHCPASPPAHSGGAYSVVGPPTITVSLINNVLAYYHSPASAKGQVIYNASVRCGIDPAYTLAFFMHESSFGKTGEATESLSPGNLRCIPDFRCTDNYVWFDSWEDGFVVYCRLIRNLYVDGWSRWQVDQIIPKYAPRGDNNDVGAYEQALKTAVDTWHQGHIQVAA